MRHLFILVMLVMALTNNATAQREAMLIPQPQSIDLLSNKKTKIESTSLIIDPQAGMAAEGYTLEIKKKKATIVAADEQGAYWAKKSLEQLKDGNGEYPEVKIADYPEFPIRGFMYDAGRNFMEVSMIMQYIDIISSYKLNVFHWHLTDNPAWRIECKVYPELNDAQFQRQTRDPGRYYTYDQIRDVIKYAKERGVTVIPEIDMPGHSAYFNTTFNTSMASEEGMKILEKCLDEFFTEIPKELCPYFHIGSDEVHINNPEEFMKWSEDICKKYERTAIAWDPGLPASETTIRQIWNEASGSNSAAAESGGRYIDSFMGYLNYFDPIIFTNRNILHNPCATGRKTNLAQGGILCLWNDVRVIDNNNIATHNGFISALLPFSEKFWSGGDIGHEGNNNILPNPNSEVGKKLQAFEKKMVFHRDNILKTPIFRYVASSTIEWTIEIPEASETITAWGGAIDMDALCQSLKFKSSDTTLAIATTKLYAHKDTIITAWVGFEAVARSNRLGNGIGEQGKWETGSQIFVNETEVTPPQEWIEPGQYYFNYATWHKPAEELPLTNEQFYWVRTPALIPLKKGENDIKLISRKSFKSQRWSFAFIPITVTLDGQVSEADSNIKTL
ncbi:MAG: family 20 glycosylhydrolase [Rikenellaceae bacterium]